MKGIDVENVDKPKSCHSRLLEMKINIDETINRLFEIQMDIRNLSYDLLLLEGFKFPTGNNILPDDFKGK